MRTTQFICTLLATFTSFTFTALASDFPNVPTEKLNRILSDSGIKGPKYDVMVDGFRKLQNAHPDYLEVIQYGQTLKGLPLIGIRMANRSVTPAANAKTIFIGGSIHGDEYLNIEDRLPEWFVTEGLKDAGIKSFFDRGGKILFAPILNPDGYSARERENAHGTDLNRDFKVNRANVVGFAEPETKSLSEWLSRETTLLNRTLNLSLDYHCCIGAMLRPWSFSGGGALPAGDEAKFVAIKQIFSQAFGASYEYGRTPDILGYSAYGTSKDYYYESYHAYGFTFEGKRSVENKNFAAHTKMWTGLINFLNSDSSR